MGHFISGDYPGFLTGTINATGTLSSEIDLSEFSVFGMIVSNGTNGTINFQVSAYSDNDTRYAENYVPLYDNAGAQVAITLPSGGSAIGSDRLVALKGYKYCKVKTTPAQATGALILLPARPL